MPSTPQPLPWMEWTPGDRVVVRYRASDGVHDALGTLVETKPDMVAIEAKRGLVRVHASQMVTGRLVSPVAGSPADAKNVY